MKKLFLAFAMLLPNTVLAQNTTGLVVSNCGALGTAYGPAGRPGPPTIDIAGNLCTSANVTTTGRYNEATPVLDEGAQRPLRLDVRGRTIITQEKRATYSAAVIDTPPATSPTDIFTISGSATKTVIVKKLLVSGTANGTIQGHIVLLKRSSANSGGTSTAIDIVSHDSTNSAATAVVRSYTANPTLGTLVGLVRAAEYTYIAASSNLSNFPIEFKFGEEEDQGVVLRGAGELLAVNLNGVSMNNSVIDISVEWREIVE